MTSFVGREAELAKAKEPLRSSRLLTLVGFGGIGKTRLALQLARDVGNDYRDGVCLVQLAPVTDGALVPWTVAAALGVSEQPGRSIGMSIAERVAAQHLLLVLDNCEHLVQACAELSERLLQACPSLRILATSRQPLGVEGEGVFSVPALALPYSAAEVDIDALRQVEAIRLFVDRATAVAPEF